jgi:hypothetical protein
MTSRGRQMTSTPPDLVAVVSDTRPLRERWALVEPTARHAVAISDICDKAPTKGPERRRGTRAVD